MDPAAAKLKHLEFIQNVVTRLAGNLFFLRGWSITLIAALFALAAKDANYKYAVVAYFPVIIFWLLDGYFLSQERRFRSLYDAVRKADASSIDFSMDTSPYAAIPRNSWAMSMIAPTLLVFYLPMIALMLTIMYLISR